MSLGRSRFYPVARKCLAAMMALHCTSTLATSILRALRYTCQGTDQHHLLEPRAMSPSASYAAGTPPGIVTKFKC